MSGVVLDARTRAPIGRALVLLGQRRVFTNHEGVFTFAATGSSFVSGGAGGVLVASKPGFYLSPHGNETSRPVRVDKNGPTEILLYPEAIVTGTVANVFGEGIPDLDVSFKRSVFNELGHYWVAYGQTRTQSDGSFRSARPAGVYTLEISQRGRPDTGTEVMLPVSMPARSASSADGIRLQMGEEVHFDFRPEIRSTHRVLLTVEAPGRAIPVLTAQSANGPTLRLNPRPVPENQGEMRVAMPSGTYAIHGSIQTQEGFSEADTTVTVVDRDVTGVVLRFAPAATLPLIVDPDSSAKLENATLPDAAQLDIAFQPVIDGPDTIGNGLRRILRRNATPAFSLPNGSYRFHGQPGRQWYITSATCGGVDLLASDLRVSPALDGTEIRVRIANNTASLSGKVSLNGSPGAGWVYLLASGPSAVPLQIIPAGVDGSFARSFVAPGSYRAVALARTIDADMQDPEVISHYLNRLQSFTVTPGEQHDLRLDAVPEGELTQ